VKGEGEEKITKVRKRMVKLGKLKQKPAGREMRTLVKQDMLRCEKRLVKKTSVWKSYLTSIFSHVRRPH